MPVPNHFTAHSAAWTHTAEPRKENTALQTSTSLEIEKLRGSHPPSAFSTGTGGEGPGAWLPASRAHTAKPPPPGNTAALSVKETSLR